MPFFSMLMPVSWPAAKPSCVRLVTPKPVPNCVALVISSAMLGIGSVAAPAALTDAGMLTLIGPAGTIGAEPLGGKVIVVTGSGAAALPPTVVPLAVRNTFQVSVPDF